MRQSHQSRKPALYDGVRRSSADLGDEANAAGIMIVREGEATFRHSTCLIRKVAKVQSSFLMRRMDFSA
jgi:hypothetical protein